MAAEPTALTHLKAFLDAASLSYQLTSRVRQSEDVKNATVIVVECAHLSCYGDVRKGHGEVYFTFNTAGTLTEISHYSQTEKQNNTDY